jgi:hypothetical protein
VVLEGEAPIQVSSILWRVNGTGDYRTLEPAWTTTVRWKEEFLLEEDRNQLEFLGVDSDGDVLAVTGILVTTTAPARLDVTGWFPDAGPAAGGTEVTYVGEGFAEGLRVFFGGAEAPRVSVRNPGVADVTTPPAPLPLPPGGRVDVELVLGNLRRLVPEGFQYTLEDGFIRGDAGGDGAVDLSDVVKVVLSIFVPAEVNLPCERSADFDDSGTLNILDALGLINYLFLEGSPPVQPFPGCGLDATPDSLGCEGFTLCE